MRRLLPVLAILSAFSLYTAFASAEDDAVTTVLASEWGITLKSDGSGFYNELARLVLAEDVGRTDYRIVPYRRSNTQFLKATDTCRYPDSIETLVADGHVKNGEAFIESIPFINVHVHLFSTPGSIPPRTAADIEESTIAYPMGARTHLKIPAKGAKFVPVSDELAKAKMLLSGRVQFIAAALPDLKFVLAAIGHPMLPYHEPYIVENLPLGIVCHQTAENNAFIDRVNRRIKTLHEGGDLALFFLHHGLDPHGYTPALTK
ncbi:MAG: ABC transporter substrate-binding protein [Alphaproteobacteria bacterium]|nr:ABC transporter substrate-binding protein [Alphaproteobacteria bacterium]